MASEILKIDANNKVVTGFVTDDANQEIRNARIDDATKGLKVMIVGGTGGGSVTSVSVVTANGFAGTVANATTTPAITLTTTISGVLKGNGTAISAAVANTDYQSPITLTTTGTSGAATFNGTTLNIPNYASGGGTPGGLNTQIQYNNAGSFGGISGAVTDGTAVSLNGAHLLNPTINGVGAGLATLVYPNTASSATVTIQAVTDTLVGRTTTDTLTNKDLTSGTNTFPTFNQNTSGSAATLTTGRTIAITGDLTYTSPSFNGSTNVTAAGTLATVNSNVGSFTNASITVNGKGLITAASNGTTAVTSVAGTTNRITVTGTTSAVVDIAATYAGQTSITTLATVTTGTWNAGAVTATAAGTAGDFTNTTNSATVQAVKFEGDRTGAADGDSAYASMFVSDVGGTQSEIARMTWQAAGAQVGAENAALIFYTKQAGTLAARYQYFTSALSPATTGVSALGTSALQWTNLFLASGGIINWAAGNATLTHSTGLITSNVPFSVGTSNSMTAGTLELGAATDTTLSRSSAGVLAVEGVVIPSISSTNTLTNKRITRRLTTTNAPGATPTTNTDNVDIMNFTGVNAAITSMTTSLSGTPNDGDKLEFRFLDNGTARAITWGTSFEATTVPLPITTVINTLLRVGFEWYATAGKWDCIAVA